MGQGMKSRKMDNTKNAEPPWKKCKLLGTSLKITSVDVKRRKVSQ